MVCYKSDWKYYIIIAVLLSTSKYVKLAHTFCWMEEFLISLLLIIFVIKYVPLSCIAFSQFDTLNSQISSEVLRSFRQFAINYVLPGKRLTTSYIIGNNLIRSNFSS